MRRLSTIYYASSVNQYERIEGGKPWVDEGGLVRSVTGVFTTTDTTKPFGPDYEWTGLDNNPEQDTLYQNVSNPANGSPDLATLSQTGYKVAVYTPRSPPQYNTQPSDQNKFPNSLRFSGFTIPYDVNINSQTIVTDLLIHITYQDNSLITGNTQVLEGKRSYTNFLVQAVKSGNIKLCPKRFDGIASTTPVTRTIRIPVYKNQSWHTNTYGPDGTPNKFFTPQRSRPAVVGWLNDDPTNFGEHFINDYFESSDKIKSLNVGEIVDPNFYIDLWVSRFNMVSNQIKIISLGLQFEFIPPSVVGGYGDSWIYRFFYGKGSACPFRSLKFKNSQQSLDESFNETNDRISWVHPEELNSSNPGLNQTTLGDYDIATQPSNGTYLKLFEKLRYPFGYTNPYGHLLSYDSDMLIGKVMPHQYDNEVDKKVSDLIVDFRINGHIYTWQHLFKYNIPRVKFTFFLMDGYPAEYAAQYNQPIFKHQAQFSDPGLKINYKQPGQEWHHYTGDWNHHHNEYMGMEHGWCWYQRPWRRHITGYSIEVMNTVSFPGMTFDDDWVNTALRNQRLFVGLVVTFHPGTGRIFQILPRPRWNILVSTARLRVNYTTSGVPAPTGPSSSIYSDGLLIRQTP